ncbi:MAG: 4-hydroxy-3-methylbut-2-enyl diphosphate reductase [Candidatus Omnitrophica bacterium]|nr:4-hydroxy-3-methylbut-2-enyl diphosphate reductase [Candidatus Omnitrophota bacterium]
MRIKIASHSGFCFGVKRAINIAEKTLKESKDSNNIYSLGSIIHNPQVVEGLSKRGLKVIKDITNIKKGVVIISSHGTTIEAIKKIRDKQLDLIDATCPFVKSAHNIVKDLKTSGYRIVIIGDKKHPEVKALLSLAGRKTKGNKIAVISQTTQSKNNYLKGVAKLLKKDFNELRIFNTICNDTAHRQALTRELLKECDVMVIVGGKNSANTRRLWHICKESGVDSYHIETDVELKKEYFSGKRCVGVVSGASTPDAMVQSVVEKIKKLA